MDLRHYLFENRIRVKDFAQKIGYTPECISNVSNKKVRPSERLAQLIYQATEGQVSVEELLKDFPPRKKSGRKKFEKNICKFCGLSVERTE